MKRGTKANRTRSRVWVATLGAAGVIGLGVGVLNLPVTMRQGVNFQVRTIQIPLSIKLMEFLDRHYWYGRLAKEMTSGVPTTEDQVLAIFRWTRERIQRVIPEGIPIVDDHVWHIIIRGYGTDDQLADVFTTLCQYAGFPAVWRLIRLAGGQGPLCLSFVRVGNRWCVFDVYHGFYFRNREGQIADAEDLVMHPHLVAEATKGLVYRGAPYEAFFHMLQPIGDPEITRAQYHMPFHRLRYELKRWLL